MFNFFRIYTLYIFSCIYFVYIFRVYTLYISSIYPYSIFTYIISFTFTHLTLTSYFVCLNSLVVSFQRFTVSKFLQVFLKFFFISTISLVIYTKMFYLILINIQKCCDLFMYIHLTFYNIQQHYVKLFYAFNSADIR